MKCDICGKHEAENMVSANIVLSKLCGVLVQSERSEQTYVCEDELCLAKVAKVIKKLSKSVLTENIKNVA